MFVKIGFLLIFILTLPAPILTQNGQKRALYYSKTENICKSDLKDDVFLKIYSDAIWRRVRFTYAHSYCNSD